MSVTPHPYDDSVPAPFWTEAEKREDELENHAYVIEARGPAATPGLNHVIDPWTGEVLVFATRGEARAHRAEILPAQPSKYLPLVVHRITL